jgi:hypothetical protein
LLKIYHVGPLNVHILLTHIWVTVTRQNVTIICTSWHWDWEYRGWPQVRYSSCHCAEFLDSDVSIWRRIMSYNRIGVSSKNVNQPSVHT